MKQTRQENFVKCDPEVSSCINYINPIVEIVNYTLSLFFSNYNNPLKIVLFGYISHHPNILVNEYISSIRRKIFLL